MEPKRIILWGDGKVGKAAVYIYEHYKPLNITVLGIADNDYTKKNVFSPEEVADLYRRDLIDGVVPTVSEKYEREIVHQLNKLGLPVFSMPGHDTKFVSASDVAFCSEKLYERFTLYHISDCYIGIDPTHSMAWMYTKTYKLSNSFNYPSLVDTIKPCIPLLTFMDCENTSQIENINDEICVLYDYWGTNYWHFTFEVFPKILLLESFGYHGKYLLGYTKFSEELTSLLGIPGNRIVWIQEDEKGRLYKGMHVLCTTPLQGDFSCALDTLCAWSRKISDDIYNERSNDFPKRIYISRQGTRKLVGMEAVLAKYGFHTVVPEKLSVREQICFFAAADIVISPHGAGSTNCVYMREGTSFIEIFPPKYLNPCCLGAFRRLGLRYQMLVGSYTKAVSEDSYDSADYTVDASLLEAAIKTFL